MGRQHQNALDTFFFCNCIWLTHNCTWMCNICIIPPGPVLDPLRISFTCGCGSECVFLVKSVQCRKFTCTSGYALHNRLMPLITDPANDISLFPSIHLLRWMGIPVCREQCPSEILFQGKYHPNRIVYCNCNTLTLSIRSVLRLLERSGSKSFRTNNCERSKDKVVWLIIWKSMQRKEEEEGDG